MTVKGIVSNVMVVVGMALMSSTFYWIGKDKGFSEAVNCCRNELEKLVNEFRTKIDTETE